LPASWDLLLRAKHLFPEANEFPRGGMAENWRVAPPRGAAAPQF